MTTAELRRDCGSWYKEHPSTFFSLDVVPVDIAVVVERNSWLLITGTRQQKIVLAPMTGVCVTRPLRFRICRTSIQIPSGACSLGTQKSIPFYSMGISAIVTSERNSYHTLFRATEPIIQASILLAVRHQVRNTFCHRIQCAGQMPTHLEWDNTRIDHSHIVCPVHFPGRIYHASFRSWQHCCTAHDMVVGPKVLLRPAGPLRGGIRR